MPICSYLVHPAPAKKESLSRSLRGLKGCEVIPADEHDLLILLTETLDDHEEAELQTALNAMPDILSITLTFGQLRAAENPTCKELSHD